MWKIAAVGECMLELSLPRGTELSRNQAPTMSFGGDTLNTAVYLSRLGVPCSYVTALGDDPFSHWMLDEWQREGVDTGLVVTVADRLPGLYMIETDAQGERRFFYWRREAPARELFADPQRAASLFDTLAGYDLVYLSGITLSLYSDEALERLFRFLGRYREQGGRIAFDGNYRPRNWQDPERARAAFARVGALAQIVLPTLEDETMLFGDTSAAVTAARLHGWGVEEIVVKQGPEGVLVSDGDGQQLVPADKVDRVVDTTAAGDSFNAGYLAGRAQGLAPGSAARLGHRLAGTVIQFPGAIIPRSAMPAAPTTEQPAHG